MAEAERLSLVKVIGRPARYGLRAAAMLFRCIAGPINNLHDLRLTTPCLVSTPDYFLLGVKNEV